MMGLGIVPLLSVGACPQQNSPCKGLGFCRETAFPGALPPGYRYFQKNNPQEGDHQQLVNDV